MARVTRKTIFIDWIMNLLGADEKTARKIYTPHRHGYYFHGSYWLTHREEDGRPVLYRDGRKAYRLEPDGSTTEVIYS